MTALRSCALCSASGSAPIVVAIAIAILPRSFPRCLNGSELFSGPSPMSRYCSIRPMAIETIGRTTHRFGDSSDLAAVAARRKPAGLLARLVRRHHRDGLVAILVGEQPLEVSYLGRVVVDDVRIARVR